jgi:translin
LKPDLAEGAREVLDARFVAREKALAESRRVIRSAANGIRALHRTEWDNAESLITEAGSRLRDLMTSLGDQPEILGHAVVSEAAKEYAEARISQAMFTGGGCPSFTDLEMDPVPYLHGLGEAVGEMRRRMLDLLRGERLGEAESLLEEMDGIVDLLAEIDYPDGMTNGLRRTTDVARSLVERSRSDLTATVIQERLRHDLRGS